VVVRAVVAALLANVDAISGYGTPSKLGLALGRPH
jgi:hypothetical protein